MIAVDNLDAVIKLIRASRTPREAREGLMKNFRPDRDSGAGDSRYAFAAPDRTEIEALRKEYAEILKTIRARVWKAFLGSERSCCASSARK